MTQKFKCGSCGNILNIDTQKNSPIDVVCWKCGSIGNKVLVTTK